MNQKLKTAYYECEKIIKSNSVTFYSAFKELDKDDAQAIYAIYAFCRVVDDFADETVDYEALLEMEEEFKNFKLYRKYTHSFFVALDDVFSRYKMDYAPFEKMIQGQIKFLHISEISSEEQLQEYCYCVAGTVGEMLIPILCDTVDKETVEIAIELGEAMQITNILRDLKEDISMQRFYLPNLKQSLDDKNDIVQLIKRYVEIANEKYNKVEGKIYLFKEKAKFPVLLALHYYQGILDKIQANNYNLPEERFYVTKKEKMKMYLKVKEELL